MLLYRPSDARHDRLIPLRVDAENRMTVPTKDLLRGLWRVQVDWRSGETGYYDEQAIVVE